MIKTLIMMIGVPGSGKSTYAQKISKEYSNIPIVSSDKIREELYGDESVQGDAQEVFDEVYHRVDENLNIFGVTILDATHCTRWSRNQALWRIMPDHVIYIIMDNDKRQAKIRNANRERVCPEFVIDRMAKSLRKEPPSKSEYSSLQIFTYDDPCLAEVLKEL